MHSHGEYDGSQGAVPVSTRFIGEKKTGKKTGRRDKNSTHSSGGYCCNGPCGNAILGSSTGTCSRWIDIRGVALWIKSMLFEGYACS